MSANQMLRGKEEERTIFLLIGKVDVQFPSNHKRPLEIDIANVGDNKLTVFGFAVNHGIFKLEDRPSIRIGGLGRLEDRRLLQVSDVTEIDRSDGRVGIPSRTAGRATWTTSTSRAPRSSRRTSWSTPGHDEVQSRALVQ